jgi:hypothetical protein
LDTAYVLAKRAFDISKLFSTTNDPIIKKMALREMSTAYSNFGSIADDEGKYAEALQHYLTSLKLKEEIGDEEGQAVALNNAALILTEMGDHKKAFEYFFKAVEINKRLNLLIMLSKNYNNIGNLYFDELNFDYVRFPSDGNMQDIYYKLMDGKNRREVMKEFFSYLKNSFKDIEVPISVDLFGYTTTNSDDLGIGQVLEDALTTVDFVCPMVYPSHYGSGFIGIDKPAKYPYEVVKYSMQHAVDKALNASSSPAKLRPWLQSFDLGAEYTPAMVRAQMQAVYDAKLDSWMLWNAGSEYNEASLIPKSH